jgi:hypothetical protein
MPRVRPLEGSPNGKTSEVSNACLDDGLAALCGDCQEERALETSEVSKAIP